MDKSSVASLRLNGKPLRFATWNSKLTIQLNALSEQRALKELQDNRAKPLSWYEDLLKSQSTLPPRPPAEDMEVTSQHDLHETLLCTQSSYIKRLLYETLPSDFKGIATKLQNSGFKSVGQLFQDLNGVRSQINVNSREALHTHMLSSQLMLVMALGPLPRHMWGSSVEFTPEAFTLENVSEKLANIFGNQSKASILDLGNGKAVNHVEAVPTKQNGSVLGKRKAQSAPANE
eukprot:jgi/Phyca11/13254/fgenesh1_pg.PHYCAscaffold_3_\